MPEFIHNPELLAEFFERQRRLCALLGLRPELVEGWLQSLRQPRRCATAPSADPAGWRTSRLTGHRHREARALLASKGPIADWLLASLPFGSLLDIADRAPPGEEIQPIVAELLERREQLFANNIGLAKTAAAPGRPDEYGDRFSAACSGLLDAIDRYVPGEGAASFAYFSAFWIRYHIYRYVQKNSCLVAYPIHQQRLRKKLGQPQFERPCVVSIQQPGGVSIDGWREPGELQLEDPGPTPASVADAGSAEITGRVAAWLRRSVSPGTRVMLAVRHSIGVLPDAAAEYLEQQREIARERLRFVSDLTTCGTLPLTRPFSAPASASLPMCMSRRC